MRYPQRWSRLGFVVLAVGGLAAACAQDEEGGTAPETPGPVVTAVAPDSGAVGDTVAIRGRNLGAERGESQVLFARVPAAVVSWSDTLVEAIVPEGATTGDLVVLVDGRESAPVNFTVIGGPRPLPKLTELVPVRTVVGDTLRILGTGFGEAADGRRVLFAGSGLLSVEAEIVQWSETEVVVLVPEGAEDGDVVVEDEGRFSNALAFQVPPRLVSFTEDLKPIFRVRGCESCHFGAGGNSGFSVLSPADVRRGGAHGPAVVPRRAAESLIIRKLSDDPPFGQRMPLGSPPLPAEEILLISDWIDQGARDN
jgi:hypothetical protein